MNTNRDVQFRIGFQASPEYEELSDANKEDFKGVFMTEIRARILAADLTNFGNGTHSITVDAATGHASETTIKAKVDEILGGLRDPLMNPAKITRDPVAGVRYAVWNSKRECIHEYFLNYEVTTANADWKVSKTYGTVAVDVQLRCSLAWDITVP